MASSGMLCRVALVRTDVSEQCIPSITRVARIGELGTMLALTSNRSSLRRNTIYTIYNPIVVFLRNVLRFLVTANDVPSSQILVTLMMEAISASETSVLTRVTRCNIPGDGILHSLYCQANYWFMT
jgi:hypothetical protein